MKLGSILAIIISIIVIGIAIILTIYFSISPQILEYKAFNSFHCSKDCVENSNIPKIIYRTNYSKNLSPSHQKAWDFTAKYNPDFQQVLLDDEDADRFMKKAMNGEVYDVYTKIIPGAAKADLIRYVLMYERGGVYLDIKSGAKELCKLIKPNDKMIVSTWGQYWSMLYSLFPIAPFVWKHKYGELQQWWLVCEPKNPIMLHVINKVVAQIRKRISQNRCKKESKILGPNSIDILETTGPWIFTKAVEEAKKQGLDSIRLTCSNGNKIMVYDVAGDHKSSYNHKPGPLLRCN